MGSQASYRDSIGHRAFVAQTLEKRQQKNRYEEIETEEFVLAKDLISPLPISPLAPVINIADFFIYYP